MKVKILDIDVFSYDIETACDIIVNSILNGPMSNYCISATGAHGLVYARKNPVFKTILNDRFYMNLPDGMPGVWIGRLKGAKNMERCYGPDFFQEVMIKTAKNNIKHFLCGGKEGVAEELKIACNEKFKNLNITGTYCPPFREMTDIEMEELSNLIISSGANIVWIGLSTPKQEIFASRLKEITKTNFIITVGAAFDFHTNGVAQAPKWIQRAGLEWLFRLVKEPGRLFNRYLEIVPLFILYNIREFILFCNPFKKSL